jgi:hypothetical protein
MGLAQLLLSGRVSHFAATDLDAAAGHGLEARCAAHAYVTASTFSDNIHDAHDYFATHASSDLHRAGWMPACSAGWPA